VIEPGNAPHFGKFLDLEMIAITEGGCERTREEFVALLDAAGFTLSRVVATDAPVSILEARPHASRIDGAGDAACAFLDTAYAWGVAYPSSGT